MNLLVDKWADFVAWLISSRLFREGYESQQSEASRREFIRTIELSARWAICFVVFLLLMVFAFLSWPPDKGTPVPEYNFNESYHHTVGADSMTVVTEANDGGDCGASCDEKSYQGRLNEFLDDKRNLNAQEGMWRASNAMVVLSIFQVIVGLGTVIFLVLTFRTQRSELSAANRTAQAAEDSEKAQLLFTVQYELHKPKAFKPPVTDFDRLNGRDFGLPIVKLGNYGRSPARDVEVAVYFETWGVKGENLGRPYSAVDLKLYRKTFPIFPSNGEQVSLPLEPELLKDLYFIPWCQDEYVYRVRTEISYKTLFGYPHAEPVVEKMSHLGHFLVGSVKTGPATNSYFASTIRTHVQAYDGDEPGDPEYD